MRPERSARTNEIGTVIPLLETVPDIAGYRHRRCAAHPAGAGLLSARRSADYMFTVKGNQPTLNDDIRLLLDETIARRAPDFTDESPKPEHGRRERRSIWVSSELNDYLDFPGVGEVRRAPRNRRGQVRPLRDGLRRHRLSAQAASPERLLSLNRGHWAIEATHASTRIAPHPLRP